MTEALSLIEPRPLAPDRVPTLTEVVELAQPGVTTSGFVPTATVLAAAPSIDALAMSAEVLFELEQRIDGHFETRLREAMAPALARAADGLIREARQELSGALRELVDDAVTRALERRTLL